MNRQRIVGLEGLVIIMVTLGWAMRVADAGKQPAKPKLPSLEPVFGVAAGQAWTYLSGDYAIAPDKDRGKPVLTVGKVPLVLESKGPVAAGREMKLLLRLRTDMAPSVSAAFQVGQKDAKDAGLRMVLSTSRGADAVYCNVTHGPKPLHDNNELAKTMDWTPEFANSFTYYPRAYGLRDLRPGWPEDFRMHIEHDMAALPDGYRKWLGVRIELRQDEVRFWLDDHLVARKTGKSIPGSGLAKIELSPGAQIADFGIAPWAPTPGFVPLRLEGYANGREFIGGAVLKPGSFAGNATTIDGIPFFIPAVNAEGKDHIDVSRSLYRQANMEGYMQSNGHRFIGSERRDPARIQLRVPNGQYDRLHLIAGCDDTPDRVPLVTAMFFRPGAGFAHSFEARVPLATAKSNDARPIPVTLANGKQVNLWLVTIPLDPGRLSAFADMDIVEIELTKKVHLFRSYPDPFIYGYHQAGLPSAVHIYGITLGQAPVGFTFEPDKFGHVWTSAETPSYTATLTNHTESPAKGKLTVITASHDGSEALKKESAFSLGLSDVGGETQKIKLAFPVKLNGYHDFVASMSVTGRIASAGPGGKLFSRDWHEFRSFVRLAPDRCAPRWTEGKGALFGYWSYHGGHYTPKGDHHITLMTLAGARTSIGIPNKDHPLVKKHWTRAPAGAWEVSAQPWAADEPVDPKKYAEYQKTVIKTYTEARKALPPEYRPDHVYFFPEPHVSQRLTEGNLPTYWQEKDYVLTKEEKQNLKRFFVTAKCAAEAIRKQWPHLKVLVPWGDALFVPPLLRAGFPKNLVDGSGIDTPGFERLPEMQLHQISVHRLYQLRKEYEKAGIKKPMLQYCEGIFVPTEPGAVSPREQMDLYNRWVLISMAYGVQRFYSGWFAFDCGNYYGSEHYGGCGIQRRIPYCDPKPAYAAYAAMTDQLDQANFDGWLKTGSLTNFCLRFKGPRGFVYTLWNIRGSRPVTLTFAADGEVHVTDAMNNTRVAKTTDRRIIVATDPSVLYVSFPANSAAGKKGIIAVSVGNSEHGDVPAILNQEQVADLGDGTWSYTSERDKIYENGTFAMMRYPGKFSAEVKDDHDQGMVLISRLEKQDAVHELMPWYNILAPKKPIVLKGAPSALGLWAKGASDWGRVIYVLRDAKGERWTSIGTQDEYNCDDVHSWSAFNFDGWRYLRFELPGHTGWDSFRKHGTTWWRSDGGDRIVDLPLTLEKIIVEQRTHILFVNDVQKVASNEVGFGKLFVEYAAPEDAKPEAIRESKLRFPLPKGVPDLPNPIAEMALSGVGEDGVSAPTQIVKLEPPLEHNDGTRVHVHFKEVAGAKNHFVWVSAHADGRGALNMTPGGTKSGSLVAGLRPGIRFYFWVTHQNGTGMMSRPSAPASTTLVNSFLEK